MTTHATDTSGPTPPLAGLRVLDIA
ncbi:MAG: hypothetical protein RJB65_2037, partial [Actinomycetota bacterium]